jgi:hypothetical protein
MPEVTQIEGFMDLRDGMNGNRDPLLLPETQFANGINVSARGGQVKTRPALVLENLNLPQALYQGGGVWSLNSGDRIVYVAAGIVYSLMVETMVLTTVGDLLDDTAQCFFEQTDKYMVIQDGINPAVILVYDVTDKEYAGSSSIPIGYAMVFAQGRLHLVPKVVPSTTEDGRASLISGDILEPLDNTTCLKFTETEYLSEGGAHSLPAEMGFINGLGVLRNSSNGTGVGQIIAFGRNGVCAFDFSIFRDYWKDQALSQVLYFSAGTDSPWSILNANNDMIYRSHDGLRILKYTASQISGGQGGLSNTPLSIEVDRYLRNDGAYLTWVSTTLQDNRVLCTASGVNATYFKGMVSWDLAAAFYGGSQGVGAYDGIWTGDNFAQVHTAMNAGNLTGYVFAEGPILYRIDGSAVYDGVNTPIESKIETKAYIFGDLVTRKKLKFADLWITDVPVDTEFEVFYRQQGYPLWASMGTRTLSVPAGGLSQSFRRVRFAVSADDTLCDPTTKEFLNTGTGFQFAIRWTGRAKIERFRAVVSLLPEQPPNLCETDGIVLTESATSGTVLNDFSYKI